MQYFTKGIVLETEMYKNPPITVNVIAVDSLSKSIKSNFYIDVVSDNKFQFRLYEDDVPKNALFGESINTYFGSIVISPVSDININKWIGIPIHIKISDVVNVVEDLRNRIGVFSSNSSSKIVTINLKDPVINKAKDIINTLVSEYDAYTSDINNRKSIDTAKLIDDRIALIFSDLENVDDSIARFKINNKVTDVTSQAGQFMSQSFQNEQETESIRTQLRLLNFTKERLSNNSDGY